MLAAHGLPLGVEVLQDHVLWPGQRGGRVEGGRDVEEREV